MEKNRITCQHKKEMKPPKGEREADLYTGQKTARGNSQPGTSPGRYDNCSGKDGHFLFSWHCFIKFQSTRTSSVLNANTVIIRSTGKVLKATCKKAQTAPIAATSLSSSPWFEPLTIETSRNKTLVCLKTKSKKLLSFFNSKNSRLLSLL